MFMSGTALVEIAHAADTLNQPHTQPQRSALGAAVILGLHPVPQTKVHDKFARVSVSALVAALIGWRAERVRTTRTVTAAMATLSVPDTGVRTLSGGSSVGIVAGSVVHLCGKSNYTIVHLPDYRWSVCPAMRAFCDTSPHSRCYPPFRQRQLLKRCISLHTRILMLLQHQQSFHSRALTLKVATQRHPALQPPCLEYPYVWCLHGRGWADGCWEARRVCSD